MKKFLLLFLVLLMSLATAISVSCSGDSSQGTERVYKLYSIENVTTTNGTSPINLKFNLGDRYLDGSILNKDYMIVTLGLEGKASVETMGAKVETTWSQDENVVNIVNFSGESSSNSSTTISFYFEDNEQKLIYKIESIEVQGDYTVKTVSYTVLVMEKQVEAFEKSVYYTKKLLKEYNDPSSSDKNETYNLGDIKINEIPLNKETMVLTLETESTGVLSVNGTKMGLSYTVDGANITLTAVNGNKLYATIQDGEIYLIQSQNSEYKMIFVLGK